MQILIDMDENLYTRLFDNGIELNTDDRYDLERSVRHGKILPTGHGRLIDADALKVSKHPTIVEYQYINEFFPNEPVCEYTEYYRCDTIRNAPTIIEADKEAEDERTD